MDMGMGIRVGMAMGMEIGIALLGEGLRPARGRPGADGHERDLWLRDISVTRQWLRADEESP